MVAFDTDMVGPLGYLADISRTLVCPGKAPTAEQRKLYDIAQEQILTNIELIKPGHVVQGVRREVLAGPRRVRAEPVHDDDPWRRPGRRVPDRCVRGRLRRLGLRRYFLEDMVVCVESYIGAVGGHEGVKLEQQVLITSAGAVPMSHDPMIDVLRS